MIGQTISRYRILRQLGEGGMGIVYVAEDAQLGRRVAIKFPAAESSGQDFRGRFLREARAVSKLTHPHIATVYDYGETSDNRPFIVMEFVEGASLKELIDERAISITRAAEIIIDIAEALAEAHRQGVIHRDIKPSNVVLNKRGQVKVLDFGLAKQLHDVQVASAAITERDPQRLLDAQTRSGAIVGTPLYLSPEQAMSAPVDARSDLFALGALLYECLTGHPAFFGPNVITIAAQVIHIDPPPPSTINPRVPKEFDNIALKALAKKPEARYQSADELIADLRKVLAASHAIDEMPTQRIPLMLDQAGQGRTPGTSALTSISDTLRRPRLSVVSLLLLLTIIGLATWEGTRWWRSSTNHQPSPEAQRWYETGTSAMRDGAYYQASKLLGNAIKADGKFVLAHVRLADAWTELDYTDKAKDELILASSLVPDRSNLESTEALYLQAMTATLSHDFKSAVESYERIAQTSPEPEKPYAYIDLGRAYEKNEDTDRAIESYITATNLNLQAAAAFLRVGTLYGRKQNLASANAALDKAESVYRDSGDFEGVTETLYQRGTLLNAFGKITEARPQLQRAFEMTETTRNKYQRIKVLLQLSSVSYSAGDTMQAKQLATEAIDLARADDIENLATQGLIDLGYALFVRREYTEAEQYFKQALDFAARAKGRRNEARAQLSLGSLYIQQEKPDEGLPFIEQALAYYQKGGYGKELSKCLIMRGRAKLLKGDYTAAFKEFDEQLQLARQVDDPAQIARSQSEIASALAKQELFPEALRHYNESYSINKSLDNPLNAGYSLLNSSDMLWQLGRYKEARESLNELSSLAARLDKDNNYRQLWSAWTYIINARISLSEQRFAEAKIGAQRAIVQVISPQYEITIAEAKSTLGLAQALSGTPLNGKKLCEEAVETATRAGDSRVLSTTLLVLAEVQLENKDAQGALIAAMKAQKGFLIGHRQESEWRAWLIAARASQRVGDYEAMRNCLSRANSSLSSLQETWGAEPFKNYLSRADIQLRYKQLNELSSITILAQPQPFNKETST